MERGDSDFPSLQHRYLCVWHVDKSWKENVTSDSASNLSLANGHQLDPAKRSQTPTSEYLYQELKRLRTVQDGSILSILITNFLEKWSGLEQKFTDYFRENYVTRTEEWAVCYRDVSIPDTTAHAEAFHNILKRVYCSKRNRYMETLLQKLMKYEEDMFIKNRG